MQAAGAEDVRIECSKGNWQQPVVRSDELPNGDVEGAGDSTEGVEL